MKSPKGNGAPTRMGIATSLKRHCVETVSRQSPAVLVNVKNRTRRKSAKGGSSTNTP